jgi:endonuclease/exonuclease/phosphatase family metal-dependent hydrolase
LQLKFATYNIHKAVGTDGRRDPGRIMAVLHEIGADVVALQEADRRFGVRESVLPRSLLDEHHWRAVPIAERGASIGWHGNAMLVKRDVEIVSCARVALTALEPRGAIWARLRHHGHELVVAGMHLDLSGIARRRQIAEVCHAIDGEGVPRVLMGDLNEWSREKGALRGFADGLQVLAPGRSFPSRRPVAMLDRIVHSPELRCEGSGVHHSALAVRASDHLPAWATFAL